MEEEGEVNETLLKVSSDSETEKNWSKEMAWESAEEGSLSLRSAWGPSHAVFPSSLPLSSTVLVCSWGSGPSQSPWLFWRKRHYSHYKVWDCLFSCVFYHTNKAPWLFDGRGTTFIIKSDSTYNTLIVLAFSFTLTALESFSSKASAFRTANYFKSSTTVADNEEAIEMICCCCFSSLASVTNLNVTRAINLTHSFGSIK